MNLIKRIILPLTAMVLALPSAIAGDLCVKVIDTSGNDAYQAASLNESYGSELTLKPGYTRYLNVNSRYILGVDAGYEIVSATKRKINYYDNNAPVCLSPAEDVPLNSTIEHHAFVIDIGENDRYLYTVKVTPTVNLDSWCNLSISDRSVVKGLRLKGHTKESTPTIPASALSANRLYYSMTDKGAVAFYPDPKSDFTKRHKRFYSVNVKGYEVPYGTHYIDLIDADGKTVSSRQINGYIPELTHGCSLWIEPEYPADKTARVEIKGLELDSLEVYNDLSQEKPAQTMVFVKKDCKIDVPLGGKIRIKPYQAYNITDFNVTYNASKDDEYYSRKDDKPISFNSGRWYEIEDIADDCTVDFTTGPASLADISILYHREHEDDEYVTIYSNGVKVDLDRIEPWEIEDFGLTYYYYHYIVDPFANLSIGYANDHIYLLDATAESNRFRGILPYNKGLFEFGEPKGNDVYEIAIHDYTLTSQKMLITGLPAEIMQDLASRYDAVIDDNSITLTVPTQEVVTFDYDPVKYDLEMRAADYFYFKNDKTETLDNGMIRVSLPDAVLSPSYANDPEQYPDYCLNVSFSYKYHGSLTIKSNKDDLVTGVRCYVCNYNPNKYCHYSALFGKIVDFTDWSSPITPPAVDVSEYPGYNDAMLVVDIDKDKYFVNDIIVDGVHYSRSKRLLSCVNEMTGRYSIPMYQGKMDKDHVIEFTAVERVYPKVTVHPPKYYNIDYPIMYCTYRSFNDTSTDLTFEWMANLHTGGNFSEGYTYEIEMDMSARIRPTDWFHMADKPHPLDYLRIARIVSASGTEVQLMDDNTIEIHNITEDYDIYLEAIEPTVEQLSGRTVHVNLPEGITAEEAGVEVYLICSDRSYNSDGSPAGDIICKAPALGDNRYGVDHPIMKFNIQDAAYYVVVYDSSVIKKDPDEHIYTWTYSEADCKYSCVYCYAGSLSEKCYETPQFIKTEFVYEGDVKLLYDDNVPDYVMSALGEKMHVICQYPGYRNPALAIPKRVYNPADNSEWYEINSVIGRYSWEKPNPNYSYPGIEYINNPQTMEAQLCTHGSVFDTHCYDGEHYTIPMSFFGLYNDVIRPDWIYDRHIIISGKTLDVINVSDDVTAAVNVTGHHGTITVTGAPEGTTVAVYSVTGVCERIGTEHTITGLTPGLHIVRVADRAFKVRL